MKLEIIKNEKNELLERSEIIAEVSEKTIPSKNDIRKNISAKLNVPEEKIIIQQMKTEFGKDKSIVFAKIYDDAKKMQKIEREYMLKRNELKKTEKSNVSNPADETAEEVKEVAEQAIEKE